jgi:hypothetical protein
MNFKAGDRIEHMDYGFKERGTVVSVGKTLVIIITDNGIKKFKFPQNIWPLVDEKK